MRKVTLRGTPPNSKGKKKMTKRERLEKKYYKAIKDGKFEEAKRIMNQIINIDVANLAKR